jgi:hypothetical protein
VSVEVGDHAHMSAEVHVEAGHVAVAWISEVFDNRILLRQIRISCEQLDSGESWSVFRICCRKPLIEVQNSGDRDEDYRCDRLPWCWCRMIYLGWTLGSLMVSYSA